MDFLKMVGFNTKIKLASNKINPCRKVKDF